jgi:hypothetical protein
MAETVHEDIDYFSRIAVGKNKSRKPLLWVRLCGLIGLVLVDIQGILFIPSALTYVSKFTYWSLNLTLTAYIIFFISTFTATKPTSTPRLIDKCAFFAFEIVWTSELVVTVFYWTALVWFSIPRFRAHVYLLLSGIESHAFPLFMLAADFRLNSMRFVKGHLYYALIPPLLYSLVTLILAYTNDVEPYPILTWKDWLSLVVVVVLISLLVAAFFVGYWIGERKARTPPTGDQLTSVAILT